ncbi:MAG: LysR family transcriptional regulator [Rhodospirillales bacterium]|nr:LysR family transcriptional regulator [Rhodospirillales bacterium]
MAKATRASRGRRLGVTQLAKTPSRGSDRARLTLRVDFGPYGALGPGKIALLEQIERRGSIMAAGKSMGMSYRRAWLLVAGVNAMFAEPAVAKQHGGSGGGKAALTAFGRKLVVEYRAMERDASKAADSRLRMLQRALADTPPETTTE